MAEERMQSGRGSKPVIENPRLPRMTDEPPDGEAGRRQAAGDEGQAEGGHRQEGAHGTGREGHRAAAQVPPGDGASEDAEVGPRQGRLRAAAAAGHRERPPPGRRGQGRRGTPRGPEAPGGDGLRGHPGRPAARGRRDPRRGRAPFLPRPGCDGPGDAGPPRGAGAGLRGQRARPEGGCHPGAATGPRDRAVPHQGRPARRGARPGRRSGGSASGSSGSSARSAA